MKKFILFSVTVALLLLSTGGFSQTLEFGILTSFETFAGAGAVTNGGTSSGDAGTNDGIISGTGFDPASGFTGTVYNNDSVTVQGRIDLLRVYIHLDDVFVTHPSTHAPAFGGGETITPGVYSIGGAGSIGGALTLDGGGNPDAVFIIKFEGAFTVGVGAEVILAGGTRATNVYWISQGAISVATSCVIKGTLFAHPGAVTLGVGSTIEGRLLTSEGAITIAAGGVADMPVGPSAIPVKCIGLCTANPIVDVLGSITNYALFTSAGAVANAATSGIVGSIGTNLGAISGFGTSTQVGFLNYPSSAEAVQAVQDLDSAYIKLIAIPNTELGHTPAFGSGETLTTGVYFTAGAGSLAGTITLDGEDDPDAVFVFKFAGAFSVAAQSKVILINGARRCNIFWISEGATDLGTFTYMKGTILAHGGACSAGANSSIEGRMLSTAGAIGFSTGTVYNDALCFGESEPVSDGDQTVCSDGTPGQTITASASNPSTTNQTMVWYDAPSGGNVVNPPSLVGIGSVTYYAESFNGAYSSDTRAAVTLTIYDCSIIVIDAVEDTIVGVNGTTGGTTPSLTANDTLNGNPVVIGTDPGNVILSGLTVPAGFTLNPDGTVTVDPNTPAGDYILTYQICEVSNPSNCDSVSSSIVISAPSIDAVEDTLDPVNGATGGTTPSLTANDTLNGNPVVIGTDPGNVILSGLTVPAGFTLNPDGTVTVDPNTPAGDYSLTYQICEVINPTNCDSVSSSIVVSAPDIDAVEDNPAPINGTTGGTTLSLTANDTLNGDPVVIGTDPGNVILSGLTVPAGFTLNPDGTVTVDPNTPAGDYILTYQICEVSNPSNCDSVSSTIVVSTPAIALVKTAAISGTGTGLLGEVVTYTFDVTNTGSTALTNVVVTDPMVGLTITGSPIASLAVGASSSVITGTYTITQSDIDAGGLTNSATATAQDPDGIDITDVSGSATDNDTPTLTSLTQNSEIALVKTAIVSGTGMLGDVITYIFKINNVGTTTLTNVVITDPMVGLIITGSPIASLAPGANAIAIGTYTITQSDIDAGGVTNAALATAQDPDGNDVTDTSGSANDNDDPTVTVTAVPVLPSPDFTPTIDIDALVFLTAGTPRDFVVNISEVEGAPSDGQVVLKLLKQSAFLITYGASTSTSNVNGGVTVNNSDWDISEGPLFLTITLKPGVIIAANTFSSIGLTMERKPDVPSQTWQPITATIVNGSGSDSRNYNNSYTSVVKAQ